MFYFLKCFIVILSTYSVVWGKWYCIPQNILCPLSTLKKKFTHVNYIELSQNKLKSNQK